MMWLLKYWRVGVVVALLAGWEFDRVAQYRKGHADGVAMVRAEQAVDAAKWQAATHKASKDYQTAKAARVAAERVEYVQVEKIIERDVYRDVCFDDDGVQLINGAIAPDGLAR